MRRLMHRIGFEVMSFNDIHDFTLFKFVKDMLTLTLYKPLDTPILNYNDKNEYYPFSLKWRGSYNFNKCLGA